MNYRRIIALAWIAFTASLSSAATLPLSSSPKPSASGAGASFAPQFSADNRWVVFLSQANNLVTNDNLAPWLDVFVRAVGGTSNTFLVSVNTNGIGGGNADAHSPSISS